MKNIKFFLFASLLLAASAAPFRAHGYSISAFRMGVATWYFASRQNQPLTCQQINAINDLKSSLEALVSKNPLTFHYTGDKQDVLIFRMKMVYDAFKIKTHEDNDSRFDLLNMWITDGGTRLYRANDRYMEQYFRLLKKLKDNSTQKNSSGTVKDLPLYDPDGWDEIDANTPLYGSDELVYNNFFMQAPLPQSATENGTTCSLKQ